MINILKRPYYCIYLLSSTFIMIIFSYLFENTQGLLYVMDYSKDPFTIKYVSELLSSGSNDNILIGLYDWFYLPLIGLSLYKKCTLSRYIIGAFLSVSFMQLISLMLLDVGSIYETIVYGKSILLSLWILSFLLVTYLAIYGILSKYKE